MGNKMGGEAKSIRFSLRTLFFVTSMFAGFTLIYIGRPYTALTIMLISIYLYFETRKSSLAELTEKKRQARIHIMLGVILMALGCYLWWQEESFQMPLFVGVACSIMGLAQWIESRSVED